MTEQSQIVVEWQGERRFAGGRPDAPLLTLDGDRRAAPGPVDAVLIALASCAAIDVVEILAKQRTPVASLRVDIDHDRADTPPRRLTRVNLRYTIDVASTRAHVERAVALATTRYCSVAASLDPELEVTTEVVLTTTEQQGGRRAR
jgi:putative redox protein